MGLLDQLEHEVMEAARAKTAAKKAYEKACDSLIAAKKARDQAEAEARDKARAARK